MPSRQTVSLLCHPATPCPAVKAIEVEAVLTAAGLKLVYRLRGRLAELAIPAPAAVEFADGLWEHTCCEAFVALAGASAYREFNFSPSGQWAAYAFSDYRLRDEVPVPVPVPQTAFRRFPDGFEVEACIAAELLPVTAPGATLELGLTAVVEAADGSRSYWALVHPEERPNFHRREAFALALAVPQP